MKRVRAGAALALALASSCRPFAPPVPAAPAPGTTAGPREVAVLPDPLEGKRWLEQDALLAISMGAAPLKVAATEVAADGDRVGTFVAIPNDQCLLAYARGSYGVEDLDLYAYADDGTTLASDEAADPRPAIVICPPHPARAYVVARVAAGRGIVAIGVHPVSVGAVPAVGRALGARGRPDEEAGRAEAWPGLDEKIAEHRRLLGAQWEEIRRVAVQADARAPTRISAQLDAGRCLEALVVPSDELSQLEMWLTDGDGRIVARGSSFGRDRAAVVCSPVQTPVSIEVRPHAGQGLCAIVLARTPVDAERQISGAIEVRRIAATADVTTTRTNRGKLLRALGYAEPTAIATGTAEVGRRGSYAIDLPEGCARVDVVGGAPLAGVAADLWDGAGALVARGDAGGELSLFACGHAGKGRLDVEAVSRPGPFAVDLRKEKLAPPALVAHPLAAGRLLGAIDGRTDLVSVGAASDARVLALDASSLKTFDVSLPDGRCADLVAALDAGGSGIDLRIVDAAGGQEQVLSSGRWVASGRMCSVGGARTLRAELRLGAGKADGLVLTRLLPVVPPR